MSAADCRLILSDCLSSFADTVQADSWGESGIFYNPGGIRKRGVYVLTIKQRDGANDRASQLDRDGVYRVNFGLPRALYCQYFGAPPPRPSKGCAVCLPYDFSTLDTLLPHPVYAWMGWVCVLNPSAETYETIKPLIRASYEFAVQKFQKSQRQKEL